MRTTVAGQMVCPRTRNCVAAISRSSSGPDDISFIAGMTYCLTAGWIELACPGGAWSKDRVRRSLSSARIEPVERELQMRRLRTSLEEGGPS